MAREVTAGRGEDEESPFGSMVGMVPGRKFVANTKITRRCPRACVHAWVCVWVWVWIGAGLVLVLVLVLDGTKCACTDCCL